MKFRKEKKYGTPDCRFEKLIDITPYDLRKMGVDAVAIDIDATSTYTASFIIHSDVRNWVKRIEAAGYPVMIVSNTVTPRAKLISMEMGNIPYFAPAFKPGTMGLRAASNKLGVPVERIAMIGDKLTTDILAANRSGSVAVKVDPLTRESLGDTLAAAAEKLAVIASVISIVTK